MLPVAATPSMVGMRRSISTTSGRSRATRATASAPVAASPTISNSVCPASMPRSPSRTTGWSSAITGRIGKDAGVAHAGKAVTVRAGRASGGAGPGRHALGRPGDAARLLGVDRQLDDQGGAGAGGALDHQRAAEAVDPLAHGGQAEAASLG